MVPGTEGGVTKHYPDGETMSIFDAAMKYKKKKCPSSFSLVTIWNGFDRAIGRRRELNFLE